MTRPVFAFEPRASVVVSRRRETREKSTGPSQSDGRDGRRNVAESRGWFFLRGRFSESRFHGFNARHSRRLRRLMQFLVTFLSNSTSSTWKRQRRWPLLQTYFIFAKYVLYFVPLLFRGDTRNRLLVCRKAPVDFKQTTSLGQGTHTDGRRGQRKI